MKEIKIKTFKLEGQEALPSFHLLKKEFKQAFFFQSQTLEHQSNLSIIGLNYDEVLRISAGVVEVENSSALNILAEDYLSLLSNKLKKLERAKTDIPYSQGGAFGCLGYEIVAQMEPKLSQTGYFKTQNDNEEAKSEIFFSRNLIVFEHQKHLIHFILADYNIDLNALSTEKTLNAAIVPIAEVSFRNFKARTGKENFLASVNVIQNHIKAGDIFQAVLSERLEKDCKIPAVKLFKELKKVCHSAYSFYFDFKASSYFGFSPEVFIKIKNKQLETHPIAGTMPRGKTPEADDENLAILTDSIKEGAEHLMLVDLARNDIGRVAKAGSVKVQEFRKVLKLSNVMHLVSIVTGEQSPSQSNMDVVKACFPAGTLSGAPKIRAMEILSTLEPGPRGFYGGAVVAFDHTGDFDSCIAIRAVEVNSGKVILRAGAGIVADSNPESEYQEIQHKLKALVHAIDTLEEVL